MDTGDLTGWLAFGTLGVALLIAIVLWMRFMRKPQNRHPMDGQRERNIDEIRQEASDSTTHDADRQRL